MNKVVGVLLAIIATVGPMAVHANDDRWFEVEVILFTHDTEESELKEEFDQKVKPIRFRRTRDLLTRYHYPDISYLARADFICPLTRQLGDVEITSIQLPEASLQTYPNIDESTDVWQTVAMFDSPAQFAERYNSRPECISSPWIDVPLVDKNHLDYHYDMYPRVIVAGEKDVNQYVHLMSPANFKLREIYRTMRRQPDIRPILHTAWRQPAGAQSRSRATRLFAGYDYSRRFDFQGNPKPQEELFVEQIEDTLTVATAEPVSVVDNIERLLTMVDNGAKINYQANRIEAEKPLGNGKDPEEVREIDGLFRIYIDPFNYLHIVAEFNVRKEVSAPIEMKDNNIATLLEQMDNPLRQQAGLMIDDGTQNTILRNYHFKQTRRVITKQVHYFDHPFMGMVVQIRRYGW